MQTGGVSAGPLTAEQLDLAGRFRFHDGVGGMLGSGGFVVFDEHVCAGRLRALPDRVQSRTSRARSACPADRGNPALVEILDRIRLGAAR